MPSDEQLGQTIRTLPKITATPLILLTKMKYRPLLLSVVFATTMMFSASVFAQSWLMAKTEELKGEYGEVAKTLQTTVNEATLLAMLQQPGTDNEILFLKMLACKRLATQGTKEAVPTLAKMLDDEKTALYARYALEQIPADEVDAALAEATKTLDGLLLIGVIGSIANRGKVEAEATLYALVATEDAKGRKYPEVAKAAIAATGALAGDGAVQFFSGGMLDAAHEGCRKQFGPEIADAAFHCANQRIARGNKEAAIKIFQTIATMSEANDFQRESAVYHEILTLGNEGVDLLVKQIHSDNPKLFAVAMKAARELPVGAEVTKKLVAQLAEVKDNARRAQLILAIGDRTDADSRKVSLAPIAALAKSDNAAVAVAAIVALKNIGDVSVLATLLDAASSANSEIAAAAKATLEGIPGKEVDQAIVALFEKGDAKTQKAAIGLIDARRIVSAFPLLKKAATSTNSEIRGAALSALAEVVTLADLENLFAVLPAATTEEQAVENQKLLKAACSRMPREEVAAKMVEILNKADEKAKPNLLDILMQIGGPTAIKTVTDYAFGNSPTMKNKATELLGKWREPEDANAVAAACLKLAQSKDQYSQRGLRGYVRYPRQYPMEETQRIEMVRTYLTLATRSEDKELVFQAFTKYPSAKMLEEAMKLLDDDSIREKACEAAVSVAEKIQGASQATADAMKKVIETARGEQTKERAKRVLEKQ
ncbi:MAG: hypothetical protein FWC43_14575 [Planctomycetaceae bacterium]|nr:hypothetical protein [Planctomycetaceae bacterium]